MRKITKYLIELFKVSEEYVSVLYFLHNEVAQL